MKKLTLIPAILLMVFAVSCKKVVTDPPPVNPVPEQKELVANPDNPDDVFGVYHNKGMDYVKAGYTLTGSYTFAEGQEQIIQLVRKWADEMANDAAFVAYCGGDKKVIQQRVVLVTDTMSRRPDFFSNQPIIEKEVKMEMMSNLPQDEAIKMGPFIDFSLDKLDSLTNKKLNESNYYKGIKVIEKDYMIISSSPKGRRYMAIMRYSPNWTLQNYPNEEPAKLWRIIVADLVGAGQEWLDGGSTVDVVIAGIVSSASAAMNKGKY